MLQHLSPGRKPLPPKAEITVLPVEHIHLILSVVDEAEQIETARVALKRPRTRIDSPLIPNRKSTVPGTNRSPSQPPSTATPPIFSVLAPHLMPLPDSCSTQNVRHIPRSGRSAGDALCGTLTIHPFRNCITGSKSPRALSLEPSEDSFQPFVGKT